MAAIVCGPVALFLLFVLLFSRRVASHSGETLRELLHDPEDLIRFGKTDIFGTEKTGKK